MSQILVTGGAGYVGAVLVPKLLAEGHSVRVLDLFLYADESIFPLSPSLSMVRCDLRDRAKVRETLKGCDVVIHLAGVSNDPSSDLDPELTREVNVRATADLIDAAREMGIRRFINASSSSVYGVKKEPNVTEDLPLEPLTVYSESKVIIEKYLDEHQGDMCAVSVRSATVCGYSPRMRLDLTVNILTDHAVRKGKITVFGGTQKRPNIHIDDITDLYCALVTAPANLINRQKFNVCGTNQTVQEIAETVRSKVDPSLPIEVVSTNDLRSYHISAEKVRKALGFTAKKTIADAVADVAQALRAGKIAEPDSDIHYNVRVMKRNLRGEP